MFLVVSVVFFRGYLWYNTTTHILSSEHVAYLAWQIGGNS